MRSTVTINKDKGGTSFSRGVVLTLGLFLQEEEFVTSVLPFLRKCDIGRNHIVIRDIASSFV